MTTDKELREAAERVRDGLAKQSWLHPTLAKDARLLAAHALRPATAQQEAVGEVIDHDSYDSNGDAFMVIVWYEDMLPVGTKLYTAPPAAPGVPAGWKLVPVEPTPEMMRAGEIALDSEIRSELDCYRAMLAAVDSQP